MSSASLVLRSRLAALVACAVCASACLKPAPPESARRVTLRPCRLEGASRPARCGTYEVFEDRARKAGRKLSLNIAIIPALAAAPRPDPLVLLAGGPGQAATEAGASVLPALERILRNRDLVLVDQRGTGKSGPLSCELEQEDAGLTARFAETFEPSAVKRCLDGLDADPRFYTTPIAMEDLEEVRAALGYPQLNLWGISYGTRAALVYLRAHPERVRSAVLDGVAPLSLRLPLHFARDSQRAMDLLFAHCAADPACAKAFPALPARFERLLARFDEGPVKAQAEDPVTGRTEALHLPRASFVGNLRGMLYMPESASLMPLVIDRAEQGDFGPFLAMSHGLEGGFSKALSLGMMFSVVCSEDAPVISDADITREAKGTWVGESLARNFLKVCEAWPRGPLPAAYREPVRSDRPVLLLSGELDPVTPPSWGEEAKKTLANSLHVVVPSVGHNTLSTGCARTLMADFIEQGALAGLSSGCGPGLQRPPFITSFAGPVP